MKPAFKNFLVPLTPAIVAGMFVPISFWAESKTSLLTSLSVIAAAVMVRLARGLPFTNPDHFEVKEIREVTTAIKSIVRSLLALILVVLGTMLTLAFFEQVRKAFIDFNRPLAVFWFDHLTSGILGFFLAFVSLRIFQVAKSDYGLVELQSRFMVRAVERKQAKLYDEAQAKALEKETPYQAPAGFGRLIQ